MEVNEIISQLKDKFGDTFDVSKVTAMLNGMDHSKMSFDQIVEKIKGANIFGDLDGDGKQESLFEEIKGKAENLLGGIFGK